MAAGLVAPRTARLVVAAASTVTTIPSAASARVAPRRTTRPIATRETHEVVDPHATRKQRHRQEEADNEHGDQHQNPGQWLQAAEAERLENARSKHTDEPPHHHGV
jgi:hypothetical protein